MKKLALIAALLAVPAQADVVGPGGRVIECYCTDTAGDRVELGQTICLHVDGRSFMARCEMSLTSPMWRKQSEGCVSSSLIDRLQRLQPAMNASAVHAKI